MTTIRIRKREREVVAKGAALLDEQMPGWASQIDLNRLQLSDSTHCVLGQLFDEPQTVPRWQDHNEASLEQAVADELSFGGNIRSEASIRTWYLQPVCTANYQLGKIVLGIQGLEEGKSPTDFGFDGDGDYDNNRSTRYDGLDLAWAQAVRDRQRASA